MTKRNIFTLLAIKNKSELDKEVEKDPKLYIITINCLKSKKLERKFTFYKLFKRALKELKDRITRKTGLSLFYNTAELSMPLYFF